MNVSLLSTPDGPGAAFLCRGDEVYAHLLFAAAEIGEVTLHVQGRDIPAVLGFPHDFLPTVPVHVAPESADAAPPAGAVIKVTYARGPARYAFLTELSGPPKGRRWTLALPATVERTERRLVERKSVLGIPGFALRVDPGDGTTRPLPLLDLATAGLAWVQRRGAPPDVSLGAAFSAQLFLPDGSVHPLHLTIMNLRPTGTGDDLVVGAHFASPSRDATGAIARALSNLPRPTG